MFDSLSSLKLNLNFAIGSLSYALNEFARGMSTHLASPNVARVPSHRYLGDAED